MTRCPECGEENPERARFCLACGRQLSVAGAVQEVHKTVTVFFSDLNGSTALGERMDPESLRGVMSRYFEAMRQVIERHGGIHRVTDELFDHVQRTRELVRETGMQGAEGSLGLRAWMVEMTSGDLEAAAREADLAIAIMREIGETGVMSTLAAILAETRVRQGQLDEAEEASRDSEEAASVDDLASQSMWRAARAQVHARRGDLESGESLARAAVEIAGRTDFTYLQGLALEALAGVMSLAGRATDSRMALEGARERYRAKGDKPDEARLAEQLEREPA